MYLLTTRYQHCLEKKIYNNYDNLILNYIDHTKNIIYKAKKCKYFKLNRKTVF